MQRQRCRVSGLFRLGVDHGRKALVVHQAEHLTDPAPLAPAIPSSRARPGSPADAPEQAGRPTSEVTGAPSNAWILGPVDAVQNQTGLRFTAWASGSAVCSDALTGL